MAIGDVDADGDIDVLCGNYNGLNVLLINDGSGGFTRQDGFPGGGTAWTVNGGVAFGDADGDGDLDIAIGNHDQANELLINDGLGTFTTSPDYDGGCVCRSGARILAEQNSAQSPAHTCEGPIRTGRKLRK